MLHFEYVSIYPNAFGMIRTGIIGLIRSNGFSLFLLASHAKPIEQVVI